MSDERLLDGKAASILNRMDAQNLISVAPERWARACGHLRQELETVIAAANDTLTREVERRREAEAEAAWLHRLVQWCRPRMRRYGKALDSYLAAGPTDAPNDPPITGQVGRQGGSHDA